MRRIGGEQQPPGRKKDTSVQAGTRKKKSHLLPAPPQSNTFRQKQLPARAEVAAASELPGTGQSRGHLVAQQRTAVWPAPPNSTSAAEMSRASLKSLARYMPRTGHSFSPLQGSWWPTCEERRGDRGDAHNAT